jgi:hypothetical protein
VRDTSGCEIRRTIHPNHLFELAWSSIVFIPCLVEAAGNRSPRVQTFSSTHVHHHQNEMALFRPG